MVDEILIYFILLSFILSQFHNIYLVELVGSDSRLFLSLKNCVYFRLCFFCRSFESHFFKNHSMCVCVCVPSMSSTTTTTKLINVNDDDEKCTVISISFNQKLFSFRVCVCVWSICHSLQKILSLSHRNRFGSDFQSICSLSVSWFHFFHFILSYLCCVCQQEQNNHTYFVYFSIRATDFFALAKQNHKFFLFNIYLVIDDLKSSKRNDNQWKTTFSFLVVIERNFTIKLNYSSLLLSFFGVDDFNWCSRNLVAFSHKKTNKIALSFFLFEWKCCVPWKKIHFDEQ